ncbi:MAG: hypothetical protein QM796_20590 [Chthoniobacteraceae bacterium]
MSRLADMLSAKSVSLITTLVNEWRYFDELEKDARKLKAPFTRAQKFVEGTGPTRSAAFKTQQARLSSIGDNLTRRIKILDTITSDKLSKDAKEQIIDDLLAEPTVVPAI